MSRHELTDNTIGIWYYLQEYYLPDGTSDRIWPDKFDAIMAREKRIQEITLYPIKNYVTYTHGKEEDGNNRASYFVVDAKVEAFVRQILSSQSEKMENKTVGIRYYSRKYYLPDGTEGYIPNDVYEAIMYKEQRLQVISLTPIRNVVAYTHGNKEGGNITGYIVNDAEVYDYVKHLLPRELPDSSDPFWWRI